MRKLKLFIATTQDGFIARPDGSIDWLTSLTFSDGEDGGYGAMYAGIDTLIVGRKTFEHVVHLSNGQYPHQDRMTKLVTSNQQYPISDSQHGKNITIYSENLVDHVRHLKVENGSDIWLCGGSTIINELMHAKLIDVLIITVVPVQIGQGIPLWDAASKELLHEWRVVLERSFDGCIQTTYIKGDR